jgi:hypothetical protein
MKKLLMVLAGIMFLGSVSMAADAENKTDEKVSEHTNPLTGTKKTKKTMKHKGHDMTGAKVDESVTETTTTKKDGTVKKDVKATSGTTDTSDKH